MTIEHNFSKKLKEIHSTAKKELGYPATKLRKMLNDYGGLKTAQTLLTPKERKKYPTGLIELLSYGRLDLSLEATVIKDQWRILFNETELQEAVKRLKALEYNIDYSDIDSYISNLTKKERTPERRSYKNNRIIRDRDLVKKIKELYSHKCQICSERLEVKGSYYAEAAHIKPLGTPHNGSDELSNLLCLCPNHHKLFDLGGFYITDDLLVLPAGRKLTIHDDHKINLECIKYHREWANS